MGSRAVRAGSRQQLKGTIGEHREIAGSQWRISYAQTLLWEFVTVGQKGLKGACNRPEFLCPKFDICLHFRFPRTTDSLVIFML